MKRAQSGLFLMTCSVMTAGCLWAYALFQGHFGENSEAHFIAEAAKRELQEEKFRRVLAENRLRDFSQDVAAVLPPEGSRRLGKVGEELREFSTQLRLPAAERLDLSGVLFGRAKDLFAEKKYDQAAKTFERMLLEYPLSRHAIEARFFLAESAYLNRDYELCLETVDFMVEQYPEHELTGFAMIRLAQISEQSNRFEEASEIYQAILGHFRHEVLLDQTRRLAQALGSK